MTGDCAARIADAVNRERERIIALLATTEFTSLDHMPHEAATLIRATAYHSEAWTPGSVKVR